MRLSKGRKITISGAGLPGRSSRRLRTLRTLRGAGGSLPAAQNQGDKDVMPDLDYHRRIRKLRASAALRPHGTRSRYHAGCKCLLCRAANSRYETGRAACRRLGAANRVVPAERARLHIEALGAAGVGYKSVADAASVARTIVAGIKYGWRRQIREHTERRILAVDRESVADGARIPAGPAWRLLDELIRLGYTKRQLAVWMGHGSIQLNRDFITARNASRVERLYRLIQAGKLQRGDNRRMV